MSHTQGEPLEATLSAMQRYLEEEGLDPETTYFWIDYMSLRQSKGTQRLRARSCESNHQWRWHHVDGSAPVAVRRIWCTFELITTLDSGAAFKVVLPKGDFSEFRDSLVNEGPKSVYDALNNIRIQKASSFKPEDCIAILKLVDPSVAISPADTDEDITAKFDESRPCAAQNAAIVSALQTASITLADKDVSLVLLSDLSGKDLSAIFCCVREHRSHHGHIE